MTALAVIIVLCLIYVGWRIATDPTWRPKTAADLIARWRAKNAADTQPIPPPAAPPEKSFTPLAELLGPVDKFDDRAALQPPPSDAPRELPHVVARKSAQAHRKGKK